MASGNRPVRVPGQPTPLPSSDHTLLMREWLELLPSAVVYLSAEGRVTYANARALELFCRPKEHLIGKTRAYCVRRGIFDGAYLAQLDEENVQERLAMRDFMDSMRGAGLASGGPPPLDQADRKRFANALDRWLTKNT